MKQRLEALIAATFLLGVVAAVAVLLLNRDHSTSGSPQRPSSSKPDLDTADSAPAGVVTFEAGRNGTFMRIRTGSCVEPGGPKLELSSNYGRTFRVIHPPQLDTGQGIDATSPVVRSIARASAASERNFTVLAADRDCVVHAYTSTDGGASWLMKFDQPKVWYIDPRTGVTVSPKGPTDNGCKKSALLSPVDTNTAVVACDDGTFRRTTDSGGSWVRVGQLDDVTAVAFASPTKGYSVTRDGACASRVHVTTDGGATWRRAGCVVKEFAIPAIAVVGDRLVAGGIGGAVMSKDDGESWGQSTKK